MFNVILSGSQQSGIEENLIRPIAEKLFELLNLEGLVKPFLLPLFEGNDEESLWQAIQYSNQICIEQGDLNGSFSRHLAIHADAGYNARGATGIYFSNSGKNFITPITQMIMDTTPWGDIGIRQRDDLGELKNTTAVAGLIELSFYDNFEELAWMQNNPDSIAMLLKTGIYNSLGIVQVAANSWEKKYNELANQYYSFKREVQDCVNKYL